MPKCTNCHTEIEFSYCSRCGNKYVGKRLTVLNIGADFLDNFFAVDNSFMSQMREMLVNPKKIIHDYWDGYRRFYFSPGRFLLIATIFFGFNFLITNNEFLGSKVSTSTSFLSLTIGFFLIFLPFFTFSSWLAYWKFKKNFYEHLVMNIYNLSLWTILFAFVSVLLNYVKLEWEIRICFQIAFVLLVVFWNSRSFETKLKSRMLYFLLNLIILSAFFIGMAFLGSTEIQP